MEKKLKAKSEKVKSSKKIKVSKPPKPPKPQKTPTTMEELMQTTHYKLTGLKRGAQVEGIVTAVMKKTLLVDIGAKTEGVVMDKEYEENKDFITTVKIGDKIKVIIFSPENDKGQILLSLKDAAADYKWTYFQKLLASQDPVEVRGLETNKGGLIARLLNVRGFVPASQLGRIYLGQPDELQNKVFQVKVIEVDKEKNRLIFSEKLVSEAGALASKKLALKKIKVGETYSGKVSGIMPFGIFVQVEDKDIFLEGLVHISEISWERVDNLNKMFRVGQPIKVKLLSLDKTSAKLNLSLKQLEDDPWKKMAEKYSKDKKVKGKVTRLTAFGAFVELEPGVEGLIHISKIPTDFDIKVGKMIDIFVETVDFQKRRMSLDLVLKEKPVGYK